MAQFTYLTQAGYEKLKSDLEEMRTTGRKEAARAIAEAREKGDLSENAEYDAAKEHQGLLEAKINEMEQKLGGARIIDETMLDTSKVGILTTVTIKNVKTNKIFLISIRSSILSQKPHRAASFATVTPKVKLLVQGQLVWEITPRWPPKFDVSQILFQSLGGLF